MPRLRVRMFGKFGLECEGLTSVALDALRAQELLSYLLLHRHHSFPRETLASLLWGDNSPCQSKKLMRQALWQLQAALESVREAGQEAAVLVTPDCVEINSRVDIWLDVAIFETAWAAAQGVPGRDWDTTLAQTVQKAVDLYRGELLEGWYQEWCLHERERFQSLYLDMLDKLMDYCEAHGQYEQGLTYGRRILGYDRARERTYRRLMRLYYLNGDRTSALRLFDRCVVALDQELGVRPARSTIALFEQIRADALDFVPLLAQVAYDPSEIIDTRVPGALFQLRQLQAALERVQREIAQDIHMLEIVLSCQSDRPSVSRMARPQHLRPSIQLIDGQLLHR